MKDLKNYIVESMPEEMAETTNDTDLKKYTDELVEMCFNALSEERQEKFRNYLIKKIDNMKPSSTKSEYLGQRGSYGMYFNDGYALYDRKFSCFDRKTKKINGNPDDIKKHYKCSTYQIIFATLFDYLQANEVISNIGPEGHSVKIWRKMEKAMIDSFRKVIIEKNNIK